MLTPIALEIEIPDHLHASLIEFLDDNSRWDFNQVFAVALAQFLKEQRIQTSRFQYPQTHYIPVRESF